MVSSPVSLTVCEDTDVRKYLKTVVTAAKKNIERIYQGALTSMRMLEKTFQKIIFKLGHEVTQERAVLALRSRQREICAKTLRQKTSWKRHHVLGDRAEEIFQRQIMSITVDCKEYWFLSQI